MYKVWHGQVVFVCNMFSEVVGYLSTNSDQLFL